MPHAFKLDKEHAKAGLVVLLLESQMVEQDMGKTDVLGFVMQRFPKDFWTSNCFITLKESPFPSGIDGLPQCAVVGPDGRLAIIGHNGELGGKLDDAIEAELKKIQTGWGKSPEAKKARAAMYGKGKLADAAKILADAESKIKDDAKEDFAEAKTELDARYAAMKNRVSVLMERGELVEAKEAATALEKAVKGKTEWETEAAALVAEFAKPEIDKELKLDKALTAIVKSMGDKKPTESHVTKFKEFAKKNEGTKVGARAADLAVAAAWKDPTAGGLAKKDDPAKKEEPPKKDDGSTPPKGQ